MIKIAVFKGAVFVFAAGKQGSGVIYTVKNLAFSQLWQGLFLFNSFLI